MTEQPRNDCQRFNNLQRDFRSGRTEALGELYGLLQETAHKTINKICQSDPRVRELTQDERKQKAHDAATYLIEQFLKRPDFEITKSYTGYLYLRVLKELYGRRNCDKMLTQANVQKMSAKKEHQYRYIVTDINTGDTVTYSSAGELYLNPVFKGLRKKRLVECIRNGTKWKNYKFELLEL